jgi:hypothetical protein
VSQASFERQPEFMAMKWNSTVNRHQCELTGTKSAHQFQARGPVRSESFEFFNHPGNKADGLEICSI